MGLDTFAARTPQDEELGEEDSRAFAGIELCGGMHSGSEGSFRGKVYDSLIEGVTGVSLYQEWIAPEVVREMAAALEACDAEKVAVEFDSSPLECEHLRRFFQICGERGLGLIGWW